MEDLKIGEEDLKIDETAAKVVADYQEQHDKALSDILLQFLTSQGTPRYKIYRQSIKRLQETQFSNPY